MKTSEFQSEIVTPLIDKIQHIFATKGVDYAGTEDRLSNFKIVAERVGITPLQVAAVYFYKHEIAMETFIKTGKLMGEPIEEKWIDMIAYIFLLNGIKLENDAEKSPSPIDI